MGYVRCVGPNQYQCLLATSDAESSQGATGHLDITLKSITIPNAPLLTEKSNISVLYLDFHNIGSDPTDLTSHSGTETTNALFEIHIPDKPSIDENGYFTINYDEHSSITHPISLDLNRNIKFRLYTSDGKSLETKHTDTIPPSKPDDKLQVSVNFELIIKQ